MSTKWMARLAMGLFLLTCLAPSVGMLFAPTVAPSANQVLAAAPQLTRTDGSFNQNVLQDVSNYLSDHLALRQEMITAAAALDSAVFGVSREEKVTLGADGWLFYTETLSDHLHTEPMTERQVWSAARSLALMKEYAHSQGARLFVTVAPNKASLYPQYLPHVGDPLPGKRDIQRLVPLLNEQGVAYIDLFSPFLRRSELLYYATDSHWTTQGAALAADVLNADMGKTTSFFSGSFLPVPEGHRGDLFEMLYPAGTWREPLVEAEGLTFQYARPFRSPEDQRIETTSSGQTGSLLVFRDSFGNSLYPFLAQSWGSALFSRSSPFSLSLLEESGADTVLIELVERNLDDLVTRPAVFPAPPRTLARAVSATAPPAWGVLSPDGAPEGFVKLSGSISEAPDVSSPIYLRAGSLVLEATPGGAWGEGETPFTLYLDNSIPAQNSMEILYFRNGILQAASLNLKEERSV